MAEVVFILTYLRSQAGHLDALSDSARGTFSTLRSNQDVDETVEIQGTAFDLWQSTLLSNQTKFSTACELL